MYMIDILEKKNTTNTYVILPLFGCLLKLPRVESQISGTIVGRQCQNDIVYLARNYTNLKVFKSNKK